MFRILIADDEKMVLLSTEKTYPFAKYHMEIVSRTCDSYEALSLLQEFFFDAALIDIRMPGLTGIDIIKSCREKDISTEFIVVSGYSDFEYMKQAIQLGAFDYCLKPVQRREADILSERLCHILLKNRLGQDAARMEKMLSTKDIRPTLHYLGFPEDIHNVTLLYLSVFSLFDIFPLLTFTGRQYAFLLSETNAALLFSVSAAEAETIIQACLRLPGCRLAAGTTDTAAGQLSRLNEQVRTDLLLTTAEHPFIRSVLPDSNDTFQLLLNDVRLHYTEDLSLQFLAQKYNFSYSYCSELFKSVTGYNFSKYITNLRMNAAARQLLQTADSTSEISYRNGYRNYHHFVKMFKSYFKETPTQYRQKRGNPHEPEKAYND